MFRAAVRDRRFVTKREVSNPYSLPAPVGGLNAYDAYTDMKPHDAVTLTNVFPEAAYVSVRKGSQAWGTGMTNPIHTLLTWYGTTGTDKLFACETTKIWDVTSAGVATSVVTGLTTPEWQCCNLANAAGNFLICCNGADAPRNYDGTTWTMPGITGVTGGATTLIVPFPFKQRLWFAATNSLSLWYLGVQAIAGAATEYPLGAVFKRGGYIVGMGAFSYDAGAGPDDYFGIVSSNGEIAVYQGTDPSSASTWAFVGLYNLGKPIGRRGIVRINGDMVIVTQDGAISMLALLQVGQESDLKAAITGKIQTLFSQYSKLYRTNFGWQAQIYPNSRYLIVNVPQIADSTQVQLVMNTVTGAWCQFNSLNGGCWGVANDKLYFGGNAGTVYQADIGYQDISSSINFEVVTAWQKPGGDGNKFYKMARPIMLTGSGVSYALGVDVDFVTTTPTGTVAATAVSGSTWPGTWPGTWGGANSIDARWQSCGALGTWASIHITGVIRGGPCQINSFEMLAEKGGPL